MQDKQQDKQPQRKAYEYLSERYDDVGTYEQFQNDLWDDKKRESIFHALQEGFSDTDDFDVFSQKILKENAYNSGSSYGKPNQPHIIDPLAKVQPVIPNAGVQKETPAKSVAQTPAKPANKELTGQERVNAFAQQMGAKLSMNPAMDSFKLETARNQNAFNPAVQPIGGSFVDAKGNTHSSKELAQIENQELSKMYAQQPTKDKLEKERDELLAPLIEERDALIKQQDDESFAVKFAKGLNRSEGGVEVTTNDRRLHELNSKIKSINDEYANYISNPEQSDYLKRLKTDKEYIKKQISVAEKKLNTLIAEKKSALIQRGYDQTEGARQFLSPEQSAIPFNHSDYSTEIAMRDVSVKKQQQVVDLLKKIQRYQNGNADGFWKGVWDVMSDGGTWDFGRGDLKEIGNILVATKLPANASKEERDAYNKMMNVLAQHQVIEGTAGQFQSNLNKYGEMFGESLPFMMQFAMTGGGFGAFKGISQAGTKLATKAVGKEVAEEIAEKGVKNYIKETGLKGFKDVAVKETIEATGKGLNTLARGTMQTFATQTPAVMADAIKRKLGGIEENEKGELQFENKKSWDNAGWQAGANAVIENVSEMLNLKLVDVKQLRNIADVFGMKRLSDMFTKFDNSTFNQYYQNANKLLRKIGITDLGGEIAEEYAGQLGRTLLNLDDAYIVNEDGSRTNLFMSSDFHTDIWGGIALSVGIMKGAALGFSGVGYANRRKATKLADRIGQEAFGEEWNAIRDAIDNATNEELGAVMRGVYLSDKYQEKQKVPAFNYATALLEQRGFNIGSAITEKDVEGYDKTLAERKRRANENYLIGNNATGEQKVDIKDRYEASRQRLEELGISTDNAESYSDLYALAEEFQRNGESAKANAVYSFINSDTQYTGLLEASAGDVDNEIEINNYIIDNRVNPDTNKIIKAKDIQGEEVYIVKGNVRVNEQGEIEIIGGDSVIIQKADGTQEMVSPTALAEFEEFDPEQLKEESNATIEQTLAQQKADEIDGNVPLQVGMQVQGLGVISAIDEQGNVAIQIEGKEEPAIIPYNSVQALLQQARVDAIKQEQAQEEQVQPIEGTPQQISAEDIGLGFTANVNGETLEVVGIYEDKFIVDYQGKMLPRTKEEIAEIVNNAQPVEEPVEEPTEEVAETKENNVDNQSVEIGNEVSKEDADYLNLSDADAWNTLVAECNGDVETAREIVNETIEDAEKALKKIKNAKLKRGNSVAEKIAIRNEHAQNIANAEAVLEKWKAIANVSYMQPVEKKTAPTTEEVVATDVAEIPDITEDKPQDARNRGFRRVNGYRVDRQQPLQVVEGKEVSIKFSNDNTTKGRVVVIDAEQLQPSHINGRRNPLHFIEEAQPKERTDDASIAGAEKIAENIRPEEITSSVTAYTGAPTVNARGEVIQGNNRSIALKSMHAKHKDQAEKYKQYLIENAENFGLNPNDIEAIENPVLVNMVDVADNEAIELGQYVAQDTESGGVERIKPENTVKKIGADMRNFANLLMRGGDEDASLTELITENGANVLQWLAKKGYITDTQYQSAFNSKGYLTEDVKNDLKGILYNSLFANAGTNLKEIFNESLPAKAQKAILATAFRDFDSPSSESMLQEIQDSIYAYYILSQDASFANAKSYKDVREAIEGWQRQYQYDDATGESFLPLERFSNFALHLAGLYKGQTQKYVQSVFNGLYDLIQGTKEDNLFETNDKTKRTLAEAIKEVLDIDYNKQQKTNRNGTNGNILLGNNTQNGEERRRGSDTNLERGESNEDKQRTDDSARGVRGDNEEVAEVTEEVDENGYPFVVSTNGTTTFGEITDDTGLTPAPIKLSVGFNKVDDRGNNIGYGLLHIEAGHGEQIKKAGYSSIESFVEDVTRNYKEIRIAKDRKSNQTYMLLELHDEKHKRTLYIELSKDGDYWTVNSGGIFRNKYTDKNDIVLPTPTIRNNANTDTVEVVGSPTEVAKGETADRGGNSSKTLSSDSKDTTNSEKVKSLEQENTTNLENEEVVKEESPVKQRLQELRKEYASETNMFERTILANEIKEFANEYIGIGKQIPFLDIDKILQSDEAFVEFLDKLERAKNGNLFTIFEEEKEKLINYLADKYDTYNKLKDKRSKKSYTDRVSLLTRVFDLFNSSGVPISNGRLPELFDLPKDLFVEYIKNVIISENPQSYPIPKNTTKSADKTEKETTTTSEYTVEPAQYTTKKGNVLDMYLVKFTNDLTKEQQRGAKELAKETKGWYDAKQEGFMMRSEESAKQLADTILNNEEAVSDAQPISLADTRKIVETESTPKEDVQSKNEGQFGLVSDERMAELKELLRKKLGGQMNIGIDPETLAFGLEIAVGHLDRGVKTFTDFAKVMISDLGDVIRPYLKAFYNGARDLPEVIESGLASDMTPYEEVQKFDVTNFDKENVDIFKTAENVDIEQNHEKEAEQAKKEIINQRNTERRIENEQTSANTEVIASQAETVASQAESDIETATTEEQLNDVVATIDKQTEEVNKQLALLGYYEADIDDSQFHESYGYMRSAEKKAVKDADALAKRIVKDLGINPASIVDKKGKKRKVIAQANIAPAGGDVYIHLPLTEDRELYINIDLEPDYKGGNRDNLFIDHIMLRIENPTEQGYRYVGRNVWVQSDATYTDMLDEIRAEIIQHVPEFDLPTRHSVSETEQKQAKSQKSKKKDVTLQGNELNLFSNNETEEENGLQGIYELRSKGLPTDSDNNTRQGGGNGNLEEVQQDRRVGIDRGTNERTEQEERGLSLSDIQRVRTDEQLNTPKNTRNNHSERGIDHAPNSIDARFKANVEAIKLAKSLTENGELPTQEQIEVLRKFSGWGGLGKVFNESASYEQNGRSYYGEPTPENKELRSILTEEEYQQAVLSANDSFYTPAYIIDTLWDIAQQMGFKGGNILEGSAGIGNILGQMPIEISNASDIQAIELDGISGQILSLLYPDAKVDIQGFENTRIENGSVDLAITNVPFVTGLKVYDTTGDNDLSKKFKDIHDFCIAKNVRKLREGGIGIFISTNGTLDNSKKLREWVVNEGNSDFVGAFRLNNKTFIGTSVTSDIIVVRKRVNNQKSENAINLNDITTERVASYKTSEYKKGKDVSVTKELSMDYNKYFVEHPERMGGEMKFGFEENNTYRPTSKSLYPTSSKDQSQMLSDFAKSFSEEEVAKRRNEQLAEEIVEKANPDRKIGEMFSSRGKLYINAMYNATPLNVNSNKVKGHTKNECFKSYDSIKQALNNVLAYQTENEDDKGLQPLLKKLNDAYDEFVDTYGHFNKNTSISFLRNDIDFANVSSIETYKEIGDGKGGVEKQFGKADVMKGRVLEKQKEPNPTNVKEGLVVSMFMFNKIDVEYISTKLNKTPNEVEKEILSSGYGFRNPITKQIEVSYQYLSGNVREKLYQAEENNTNGEFDRNIEELKKVIPLDIPAHLIDFNLGSSWIDPKLYTDYIKERTDVDVNLVAVNGVWVIQEPYYVDYEKNKALGVVSQMLNKRILGHTLIGAAIQNKTITVSKTEKDYWTGETTTIVDKEATQSCNSKIDEIRLDFKDWASEKMRNDAELSKQIEKKFNDLFNNYVPMEISEEFLPKHFEGSNHKYEMRTHQKKAIVKGTQQPLMLAHEVGSGKTFTLISIAMEMRRLGTARKPMIVVQNSTIGQFVGEAKKLYPNAKILTLEDADRNQEGRKNFYAKIRYNDWDLIIIPQSTFERIPDSEDRQIAFIESKINEKLSSIAIMQETQDAKENEIFIRQIEKELEKLEEEKANLGKDAIKKRTAKEKKQEAVSIENAKVKAQEMLERETDDVDDFDTMGIDALLIDEAHEYKHLGFETQMRRGVKGVDPSYSKKSQGVYLKTQAVLENNNGKNVIFATGTPISNTAAEIWTFMRYLMPADVMKDYGIYYFDDFARNFGNIQEMLEFSTSGKYKENKRFAGYINLPELVRIWSQIADTVTFKDIEEDRKKRGEPDLRPEIETGKAQDIYLPQTPALRSIMKFVKKELDRFEEMSGADKKANSHIPLVMYGIAKAGAVDARLVQEDAVDNENSKTNEAVRQTLRSLKETDSYKGTVAIFADNYQNKESGFNLYVDIKNKLIQKGVPENEIAIINSSLSIKKKLEIFDKVNRGEIRVILGSTFTLGTGVNIQERLHTLIHLDAPNRPMDYTQRNGRIHRQGNIHKDMGKPIRILRFGVEDSLDVTAYQRLKTKGAIADSIMQGKNTMQNSMTNRVLEEDEDVFGNVVAQLSGSEYALLKDNAEKNVRKYLSRKKQYDADQIYINATKPKLKGLIKGAEKDIEEYSELLNLVRKDFPNGKFKQIKVGKHTYNSIEEMESLFKETNKAIQADQQNLKTSDNSNAGTRTQEINIDGYNFVVTTTFNKGIESKYGTLSFEVHRKMTYSCDKLGIENSPVKNGFIKNAVEEIVNDIISGKDFEERLKNAETRKEHNESELKQLESREGKPFEYEEELKKAKSNLEEYTKLMVEEMKNKEAKYAEMDAEIEEAENISLSNQEESEEDDDILYRSSEEDETMFRELENEELINELENSPKMKVYRAMQVIDGKLYPPMSAKVDGKLREPIELGVWEEAEERPDLADDKGNFKLNKGNSKSLSARYNPYFHTSPTPLNDQFKSAQDRPNLVTVEVEIPVSELTSGYKAEKAKDSVGKLEWKAGVIQGQLSGTRTVILSRWDKPIRIVPDSEVAQKIVEMFGDKKITMPSNVVTPSLRAELEKLGVPFVETDNTGKVIGNISERQGGKTYTDEELSYENDPIAKVLGKPRYSLSQRKAFARKQRERMLNHAVGVIEKLHLDNVEIVTDVETLQGKRKKAKGFYNTTTGKITIVVPNHTDIHDVQETILHEAVAHYGLRKLFGEHFDTFLENVYNNASQEVREQIVALSIKHNWDFAKATEEYLASLAETTNFEDAINTSWWQKIKDLFVKMLRQLGLNDFRGETLTDNELRYILWRSYQNLIDPNAYRNPFAVAEDVVMQDELKVGNYATVNEERAKVAEEDVLFREQQEEENSIERYNRKINNGAYQSYEAFTDSMASVKAVMEQATGEKVRDIAGYENAYLGENALSSANKAQIDWATEHLFKPLYNVVYSLAKNEEERNELVNYLFAKHGLERNEKMRADVEEANKKAIEKTNKINEELKADYTRRIIAGEEVGELKLQEPKLQKTNRDFAGLIGLTRIESVNRAEEKAKQIVGEYEEKFNTKELWEKINAITKETLKKSLDSGIISPETYNKISSMYKYYIPLRGFDETTAEDMFSYLTNQEFGRFTPAFIKARGRRSKADNPFAFMESMYESAVLQGNRNTMVKQRFLNFVNNHPSELFSVSKNLWLQYDVEENAWKPVFPKLEEGDSAEVIKKKTAEFEKEMRQKAKEQPDSYKNASEGNEKLPYKFEVKSNKHQHQIIVKQNGKDIVITVNGNPRVAQAINGLANPDNDFSGASGAILSGTQNIGRYLSTMYTSASLDFLIKNFIRDSFYSNFMAWVRENPKYALRFNGNYLRFFVENLLRFISGNNLFRKWRKGTLNRDNKAERLFEEFMLNGGETGYVELKNIEEHKKEIAKKIKKSKDAWKMIMYQLASVNRMIENNARFAAYYTSRNMGRDIARSVYDAKEISGNFNKKGAGSKFLNATGQTALGKASAFTSGAGRSLYIFWNPAIQGLAQFLRAFREHPIKSSVLTATAIGAGIATAWWLSGDDEEEEKYYNIPERIRRQNLIISIGENYLALPLPIEFRAFYGFGELLYSVTSGKEYMTSGELAMNIAEQFSQVLPINFLEGENPLMQLVPSAIKPIVEVGRNESWTGLPIYKDDSFGGIVEGHKPEYQNVYKNANPTFVEISKQINDWTGGDDVKEGSVDINPAIVEHLAKGYLGGIFNLSNDITNLIYTALGDREFDVRDVPAFGAVVAKADERTQYRAVNNRYYNAKKEADEMKYLETGYNKEINNGNNEYKKVLEELKKTPEYKRFEIFEEARKGAEGIDKLNRELKKATEKNNEERMVELNKALYEKKKAMLGKQKRISKTE